MRIVTYISTDPQEADYRHLAVAFEKGTPVAHAASQTAEGARRKLLAAMEPTTETGARAPQATPEVGDVI